MVRRTALHAYDVKLVGKVGYGFGVAVDDRDVVPLLRKYFCNRVANLAGSYNNYFHSLLLCIKSTQKLFYIISFSRIKARAICPFAGLGRNSRCAREIFGLRAGIFSCNFVE